MVQFHATTICAVRRGPDDICIGGDGQVTMGETAIMKNGAKKVWVDPNPDNVKAIALYERLGFVRKPMPEHLLDEDGTTSIYMELIRKEQM